MKMNETKNDFDSSQFDQDDHDHYRENDDHEALLTPTTKNQTIDVILTSSATFHHEWMRPYWLGMGLFFVLLPFWLLDSLKDPILGMLTNSLEKHQPSAKLWSVFTTLCLVGFFEYTSDQRKAAQSSSESTTRKLSTEWSRMSISHDNLLTHSDSDRVSNSIFMAVGIPYCLLFGCIAYFLQFHTPDDDASQWKILGYITFVAIESYGSIAVATFWSYVNSTLSLPEAERYYGTIIALAQLGAIAGSTMVTTHIWNHVTLIILACLVIILHIVTMTIYGRKFPPTVAMPSTISTQTSQELWSGIWLIVKHNYVLLILGVSCLYEVSLTCLNYQMTLLGYQRFEEEMSNTNMTFTQFMGHYGQLVNVSSLFLSLFAFPWLIKRVGLRWTLRLFPSLLLIANIIAFGALPGNLTVLFLCMSSLKAMTYSIHDPSKEILYMPTSNTIKFKSKFWIDVVGARIAKALGSSINTLAGSVDRSIRVASAPSLLTAAALWWVCYRAGLYFDHLVSTKTMVGTEVVRDYDPLRTLDEYDDNDNDDEDDVLFDNPRGTMELSPHVLF